MKHISKKGLVLLIGGILCVALIAWLVLVVGIFRKSGEKEEEIEIPEWVGAGTRQTYELPEVPEGYKIVFRQSAEYEISKSGEVTLVWKNSYNKGGDITETRYYDADGNVTKRDIYKTRKDGLTYSVISYNEQGEVEAETFYTYDSNKNLIEEIHWGLYEDDVYVVQKKLTYAYNPDGKKIRETEYNSDVIVYKDSFYDSEGHILEERYPRTGGGYFYTYNEKGDLLQKKETWYLGGELQEDIIEENLYRTDGLLQENHYRGDTTKYEYTDKGVLAWKKVYDSEGTLKEQEEYNEKGLKTRWTQFSEEAEYTQTREYNDNGNMISMISYQDGVMTSWYEMEYDEIGAKYDRYTLVIRKDSDGNEISSTEKKYVELGEKRIACVMQMDYEGNSETAKSGYVVELDEYGNETRLKYYKNGELESQTVYEYTPVAVPDEKGKNDGQ